MNNREFDDILDECLERLLSRGETVEQCLHSFPDQADELRPLLETVLQAGKVKTLQPSPEFRNRARYQMNAAFRDMEARKSRSFFNWGWQPRWATAAVAVVLVLLLSGGGTVAAASGSMPGQVLYPVKLATEQARLAFTFSELGKAEVYAQLADRRVGEIVYLAGENKPEQIEQTTDRLNKELAQVVNLSSTGADLTMSAAEGKAYAPVVPGLPQMASTGSGEHDNESQPEQSETSHPTTPAIAGAGNPASENTTGAGQPPIPTTIEPPEEAANPEMTPPAPVTVKPIQREPGGTVNAYSSLSRRAELQMTVINQANANSARLWAALETAPDEAKPALIQAINSLEADYQRAIESLEGP